MLIAFVLIALIGGAMIIKPKKILQIVKGPLVPQHSNIEVVWIHKIRYSGWFVLVCGVLGMINVIFQ